MAILTTEAKVKINNYKDALYKLAPNNEIVEAENPEEEPVNKYTDSEWVDELTKRYFVNLIKRGQAVLHKESLEITEVNLE